MSRLFMCTLLSSINASLFSVIHLNVHPFVNFKRDSSHIRMRKLKSVFEFRRHTSVWPLTIQYCLDEVDKMYIVLFVTTP